MYCSLVGCDKDMPWHFTRQFKIIRGVKGVFNILNIFSFSPDPPTGKRAWVGVGVGERNTAWEEDYNHKQVTTATRLKERKAWADTRVKEIRRNAEGHQHYYCSRRPSEPGLNTMQQDDERRVKQLPGGFTNGDRTLLNERAFLCIIN